MTCDFGLDEFIDLRKYFRLAEFEEFVGGESIHIHQHIHLKMNAFVSNIPLLYFDQGR